MQNRHEIEKQRLIGAISAQESRVRVWLRGRNAHAIMRPLVRQEIALLRRLRGSLSALQAKEA
jgi:hypothetical protein